MSERYIPKPATGISYECRKHSLFEPSNGENQISELDWICFDMRAAPIFPFRYSPVILLDQLFLDRLGDINIPNGAIIRAFASPAL